jgi:hypothetical protein
MANRGATEIQAGGLGMSSQKRILELTAEIKELEELLAKAERNTDLEGRWVVYLLKDLLERRKLALSQIESPGIRLH